MANKYAAKGAIITIGAAVIDGVQSLAIPSDTADLIDVTAHDSANNRKEYVNGNVDSDDLSLTMVYDAADTEHETIRAAAGGVAQAFVITLPTVASNNTHTFSALVTGHSIDLAHDGAQIATATLKRTGADTVSTV